MPYYCVTIRNDNRPYTNSISAKSEIVALRIAISEFKATHGYEPNGEDVLIAPDLEKILKFL